MTKEELLALGISEEQIAEIMKMNGKAIENVKSKYADYDDTKKALETTQQELGAIKALKPEEMQTKLAELSNQLETERKESAANLAAIERKGKINDYLSGKKFANDFTKEAIASKFETTLASDESKGKSFDDLFTEIVPDTAGVIIDDNAPKPPLQGQIKQGDGDIGADDVAVRNAYGLPTK